MNNTSLTTRRTFIGAAAGLSVLLAVTACSGSNPLSSDSSSAASGGPVVVGSANFPENAIIAEIYAGALNAAGVTSTTKLNIGAREVYIKAIKDGSVDVVPDYSGNLLGFVDPTNTVTDPEGIVAALPAKLPAGLAVLNASSAEDKDAMVVTAGTAAKYGNLKTIEDLAKVCDQLTLGAPPEFKTRPYGLPGLAKIYNCVPKAFTPVSDGGGPLTVKALLNDEIQVADIFTTSPAIPANNLVVLEDPLHNWLAQQVLPLVKTERINDAAKTALNDVSAKLTTADLISLRDQVEGDQKMDPKVAATAWLKDKGITN
ncbi:glycine/betaine ABC transporter substrate-binding protein [Arthrobacter alpinus]|uniref:Glycine/betaine ABC transporter substrate-binding protein n=1 Tax=Arthrobacter alpinus TaxID=656366 RepID=A0A0M4RR78_9MICC|nr:ABC transporter substrate-binding protein [Arthrobacter alpinus]ALE93288.1 glycine/betaine ABC transporter substrate-binding protein [Arthrobacter alpinus]